MDMARTTQHDLDVLVGNLNDMTGNRYGFCIGHAYGKPRLESHGGSRDVSPRMSAGQLYEWMMGFQSGLGHATHTGYYGREERYHYKPPTQRMTETLQSARVGVVYSEEHNAFGYQIDGVFFEIVDPPARLGPAF